MINLYEQELNTIVRQSELPWDDLAGKTIMISGATGMLGKCLIDLLMCYNSVVSEETNQEKVINIIALSRNEQTARKRFLPYWDKSCFRYISCDVNGAIPECGKVDYLIHAASNTHPQQYAKDSIGTIASNVVGTKNLLDYAVSHDTKQFCFISSVEIYGENRGDVEKFDESYLGYIDCNTLRAGYPESKRLGEALCNAYHQTHGLEFTIARLSRVYGPTMLRSDTKAISQFIRKAAAGEDIVLKSEGNQQYSYTFVTDAAAAILRIMLFGKSGHAYNVANEESDIALKELAQHLADIAGTKVVYELPDEIEKKGYSTATKAMLDTAKLQSIGWRPRVPMKEGMRCTVEGVS